jgi:hypothetical protein
MVIGETNPETHLEVTSLSSYMPWAFGLNNFVGEQTLALPHAWKILNAIVCQ